MKKLILLLLLQATAAKAQVPINAILNTATPQNAQFNVGTGTVRGTLTVGSLVTSNLTVGALTVTSISGSGAGLTSLPAAQLTGTVASARIAGAYTGITQVGTITAGTWHGDVLGTQYGGTGQNFINVSTGDLVYFSGTGVMAALTPGSPQQLLQSNGFAAPSWTGSPTINGQNIQNVQTAYLSTGTLPSYTKVGDASILAVSGSKVQGNISGFSVSVSSPIGIYQLAPGILPFVIPASSITPTGVSPAVYGSSNTSVQITVGADGRIRTAASLPIPGVGPNTAKTDVDNGFTAPQTIRFSSFTVGGNGLFFGTVTASNFIGDGSQLTNINAANVNGIVNGTGTASQFSYFTGLRTIASSGAFTLNGTTIRVGNLNTPSPTSDVHLISGGGVRAYNINLSEDPINFEVATSAGGQAAIGFSINGLQQVHIGQSNNHNFIMYDDDIGGGLGLFFKEFGGTGRIALGTIQTGETSVQTPTSVNIYGVMTNIGTAALQPASTNSNGTLYYNSGPNHYQFSENGNGYVTLPGLANTGFTGAIPYFTVNNGTYLSSDVNFTTNTVLAKFSDVGVSTASLDVRLTATEAGVAALRVSTASLQAQIDVHTVSIAQLKNQDIQIALSTAAIAFSTGTLQTSIAQLNQSTISLQAQISAIVISSTALQAEVDALSVSTAALHSIDLSIGVSTASLQSQATALGINIATETAARIAADTLIGASTAAIQAQVSANAATLGVLGISTNSLQVQITALGASTATESAARASADNLIGASTAALHAIDLSIGTSTSSLQTQLTAVGASTAANQVQITALGASTNTLNQVKASTGTNNDITDLDALTAIAGPFTVDVGSVTILSPALVFGDFTVNVGTVYAQGGSIAVSSASNHPVSWLILGRDSNNASFLTNSGTSGVLTYMPGKTNPQLIMGNSNSTGSSFIDASSGRPLFLNALTTGTVTIGGSGQTTVVVSPSLFSIGTSTFIITGGHIAIGTTTTSAADLSIVQQTNFAGLVMDHYSSDAVGPAFIGRKAEGTIDAPTAVLSGDRLATFGGIGADAGSSTFPSSSTANMQISAAENFTSTNHGTLIKFNTTAIGTTTVVTALQAGPGNSITVSSVAFMGVTYSTAASAGAGVANTVLCPSGKYAEYGGCDCTGTALVTAVVNRPNSVTAGVLPTGHTCQVVGTPGGACAAFVRCSVIQ